MKTKIGALALLLAASSAHATVTFYYKATVNNVLTGAAATYGAPLQIGDVVTGSYSFDPSTPMTGPAYLNAITDSTLAFAAEPISGVGPLSPIPFVSTNSETPHAILPDTNSFGFGQYLAVDDLTINGVPSQWVLNLTGTLNFDGNALPVLAPFLRSIPISDFIQVSPYGDLNQGFMATIDSISLSPIPEPSSYAMLAAGLVLLTPALLRRRRVSSPRP